MKIKIIKLQNLELYVRSISSELKLTSFPNQAKQFNFSGDLKKLDLIANICPSLYFCIKYLETNKYKFKVMDLEDEETNDLRLLRNKS